MFGDAGFTQQKKHGNPSRERHEEMRGGVLGIEKIQEKVVRETVREEEVAQRPW